MSTVRLFDSSGNPVYSREHIYMTVEDLQERLNLTDEQVALPRRLHETLEALQDNPNYGYDCWINAQVDLVCRLIGIPNPLNDF